MTSPTKANFVEQGEFTQLIADNKLLVSYYTAPSCGPCKAVTPLIDKLAIEYGDRVSVVKVDIDESPENAKKYGIRSIPAVLVFRDGEVIESLFGLKPYEAFSNILEIQLRL